MNVVLWSVLTIALYVAFERIARALNDTPLVNPVMWTTLTLIALLHRTGVPYPAYASATGWLAFLLVPATIAIAVPLARELKAIRTNAAVLLFALLCGSASAVVIGVAMAAAFHLPAGVVRAFAAKSVTTPVAMAVSSQIGGIPSLAAVFAIVSGIIGALAVPAALRLARHPRFAGFAVGIASHGIGTARLAQVSLAAAAFSGLALGLNAILTALVLPLVFAWVQ